MGWHRRLEEDTYKKNIARHLGVILIMIVTFTVIIMDYDEDSTNNGHQSHIQTGAIYVSAQVIKSNSIIEYVNHTDNQNSIDMVGKNTDKDEENGVHKGTSKMSGTKQGTNKTTKKFSKDIAKKDKVKKEETSKVNQVILDEVNKRLSMMTLEEKICQMFIVSPEELTNYFNVTAAGEKTKRAIRRYPVGGVIYYSGNIQSESQLKKLLANTNTYATANNGIPMFLGVDEEGGQVARIANNKNFNVARFDNMTYVTSKKEAYTVGSTIGSYLKELGFNLDFAPVADVLTNEKNELMKERSFGTKSEKVADYAYEVAKGLNDQGIFTSYKHFPGQGATIGDSHIDVAVTDKDYEEIYCEDFGPFLDAIDKNMDMIMVGHISAPNVIGDNTPSSLSKLMVTDILRDRLSYNGVIITDAMNMSAISKNYTVEQSTVEAIKAGCDIVLMPTDFRRAYVSVIKAVNNKEITEKQIDESVRRILILKKRRLSF